MAIDDVMSNLANQVANGANLSIQPASGDEWLVTAILIESGLCTLRAGGDTGQIAVGTVGGLTGDTDDLRDWGGLRPISYFVTNSEYLDINNAAGSTKNLGFSAIKSKE